MAGAVGPGAFLRQRREAKGLSLADLSGATRIAPRFLDALEHDRLDALPAPVFVRGFIRAYCAAVGEAPDGPLRLYDTRVEATAPAPRPVPAAALRGPAAPRPLSWAPVTPRPAVRSTFVAAAVAVVLGGVAAYLVARGTQIPSAAQPAPQPAAAPPAPAVGVTPAPAPPPPVAPATSRVLVMRAHDATWVRVRPQDAPPSEEILQPGTVREWRSRGRFLVTVGNAGGVALELDGVALPPLGKTGEVVRDVTIPPEPRS